MTDSKNPLISFNTYETLSHVNSVISFLQSYYCLNEIPEKRPPENFDEEVYTGLYHVLSTMGQAVAFEMDRLQTDKVSVKIE